MWYVTSQSECFLGVGFQKLYTPLEGYGLIDHVSLYLLGDAIYDTRLGD